MLLICTLDMYMVSTFQLSVIFRPYPDPLHRVTHPTRNTFITSSPRWLITLTAMRPVSGLGKGREVSLFRVAQASASISAFKVVLRERYGSLAPRK